MKNKNAGVMKVIYTKLVRDKIADLFGRENNEVQLSTLSGLEYKIALAKKLQEEALEFSQAKSKGEEIEELADVLEVIHAILSELGVQYAQLEHIRRKKLNLRGGFKKRICLASAEKPLCPFCNRQIEIVAQFVHCYVIRDQFPVSNGHHLIIPNEHFANWFETPEEVRLDMLQALDFIKSHIERVLNPDGFNIGMNCGIAAGQSIMHLHMHLIPRYRGDVENPFGGVRGVIPDKQKY